MLKREPGATFRNPAFAQHNALFAPPERFADQRPLFETDASHFMLAN